MNLPERSITRQTLYAMYEKDKILNSFPPDLAKDVRRVLDMLVMKNDDISSRYYIVNLGGLNIAIPERVYMWTSLIIQYVWSRKMYFMHTA